MARRPEDNSSEELRALREAYCAHFLATGEFAQELRVRLEQEAAKLRGVPQVDRRKGTRRLFFSPCACGREYFAKGLCVRCYSARAYQKRKEKLANAETV